MAIIGPVLAVNSESLGRRIFRVRRTPTPARDIVQAEGIALLEAVTADPTLDEVVAEAAEALAETKAAPEAGSFDALADQASQQSDELSARTRDPEY
jgi:hypothetical protein